MAALGVAAADQDDPGREGGCRLQAEHAEPGPGLQGEPGQDVRGKISATDRLVRSPPAFVSPRARRSATWALVRPVDGVSTTWAADGVAAA
jgi:hypothetical protein